MEIQRDSYLEQLIAYRWDGMVKVITGIRRCGKSYLLKVLFRRYLIEQGVRPEQIITIELDLAKDIKYRNPLELAAFVRGQAEKRSGSTSSWTRSRCPTRWPTPTIRRAPRSPFTTR